MVTCVSLETLPFIWTYKGGKIGIWWQKRGSYKMWYSVQNLCDLKIALRFWLSLCLFRNMELKSYRPYQPYLIFLNMVMEGVHSQLYLLPPFSGRILKLFRLFYQQGASWEPCCFGFESWKACSSLLGAHSYCNNHYP